MSKNTIKINLNKIVDVVAGQSPKSIYYSSNEGVPFLQGNRTFGGLYPTIDTYTKKVTKLARKGDLLISVRAPVGDLNFAHCDLCIGRGLAGIRAKNGDNNFVYYALKFNLKKLLKKGTGTTFDSINKDTLEDLEIIIPETEVDRFKISKTLSNIDAKIELNNQINSELEKIAKTIYDYWFVQFDFPDANGKPYKSSGGPMVWNEELKREIPQEWEVNKLGKAIKIVRGASPRPIDDFLSNEGMPWVKISDATKSDNRFIVETKQFIIQDGVSSSRSVFPNTLILSNSASPCIPRIMKINACVHDGWLIIEEYTEGLTPEFMFHYFEYERPRIICLGSGSIFKNLKTDYLKDLKFILPHKSVLDQITPMFKTISESIFNQTLENQKLTELRDWLLPMLMNGQVKVE